MSTPIAYLDAVRGICDHLQATQLPTVEQAADLIIHALTHGGAIFTSEVGHSNQHDFLNRAGGMAALQPLSFSCNVNAPVAECLKNRPRPEPYDPQRENIRHAIKASNLRAGDVVLVGSVSGKSFFPVELTLSCQEIGVKVIGFTSLAYTAQVESLHPSGKKLVDVADVVIDIGAPYGDAAVAVPGVDVDVLPVSGVAAITAGWMVFGRVMEKMAAAGTPPSVFMSINRKEGPDYYDKSKKRYHELGY